MLSDGGPRRTLQPGGPESKHLGYHIHRSRKCERNNSSLDRWEPRVRRVGAPAFRPVNPAPPEKGFSLGSWGKKDRISILRRMLASWAEARFVIHQPNLPALASHLPEPQHPV